MSSKLAGFRHGQFTLEQAWKWEKDEIIEEFIKKAEELCRMNGETKASLALLKVPQTAASIMEKLETGLDWDNMMTEPPITPRFMGPHGVDLPLYSISHELAWLMTVTSKADHGWADFNNFYAYVAALYHQWHSKLVDDAVHKDAFEDAASRYLGFMVSIAIYEHESSGALPLLLVGASNPGNETRKGQIRAKMVAILTALGFNRPAVAGQNPRVEPYGNCAETWQWIIAKKLGKSGRVVKCIAIRKQIAGEWEKVRANIKSSVRPPCPCCQQLAKAAGYSELEVQNKFSREAMDEICKGF